ncbi:MAG: phosphoribosyltransferase family protein [Phycisphaerales bacterium]
MRSRRGSPTARQIAGDLDRLGPRRASSWCPCSPGASSSWRIWSGSFPQARIGVTTVSSYPGKSTESQGVSMVGDLPPGLAGRHVLVVDDALDSGRTLGARATIAAQGPATLRTCVLLRKQVPSALATPCDYVGFDIPDVFVVGYGLDYDDHYRNLPYVGVLRPEAM